MDKLLSFKVFGLGYFIYFVLCVGIVLGLVFGLKNLEGNKRKIVNIVLVSCIGAFALIEYISRLIVTPNTKFGDQMPLELLDVIAGFSIFVLVSKKEKWKKFSYLIFAPVSLYSLIFVPNVYTQLNTISVCIIFYYLAFALVISYSVLNILWLDQDLEKKDILDATLTFAIILSVAHILNVFFRFAVIGVHANYLGTMGEDYDLIIGLLFKLIPVQFLCMLPLVALLVGVEFLLILPFDLIKSKRNAQAQVEELIALGNIKAQAEYHKKHSKNKSQILVRSENKAMPSKKKDVTQSTSDKDFVKTTKEVNVNNDKE